MTVKTKFDMKEAQARLDALMTDPPKKRVPKRTFVPTGVFSEAEEKHYATVSSRMVYTDITDLINNRPFHAFFPQTFAPMSAYYAEFGTNLNNFIHEDEDVSRGTCTIATMIDIVYNNKPLRIIADTDVMLIKKVLEVYIDFLRPLAVDRRTQEQLKRVEYFLSFINRDSMVIHRKWGEKAADKVASMWDILKKAVS